MDKVIRALAGLGSVAMALVLLFAADIAFSLSGLERLFGIAAAVLVVFSALSLLPLVQEKLRKGRRGEYKVAAFVAGLSLVLYFSMSAIRSYRESQGIAPLLHDSGNCTTLFSPVMRSLPMQHWLLAKKPSLRYGEQVLQDTCKMAELRQEFSSPQPSICSADEGSDPDRCYRDVLDQVMSRDPLTMPGVGLAFSEGMFLAMRDRGPRADSASSREQRIIGEYRLASSTLGLVAAVLRATERHLTPGDLLGESSQVATGEAPEWEVMRILYRRNWISDEDEVHILDQLDRKLDQSLTHELEESAKKIVSKLEKPKNSDVAVSVAPYQDQISHFNQLIHGYEEENI